MNAAAAWGTGGGEGRVVQLTLTKARALYSVWESSHMSANERYSD